MAIKNTVPGNGGNIYVPYSERTGDESVVFFTRDLSEAGLRRVVHIEKSRLYITCQSCAACFAGNFRLSIFHCCNESGITDRRNTGIF